MKIEGIVSGFIFLIATGIYRLWFGYSRRKSAKKARKLVYEEPPKF